MLDWLKTPGVRPVLRSVAAGGAVTHQALDALPQGRTLAHVRSMLVAAGALPARDERRTALEAWIARAIAQRADPGHRRVLHGYAVWHHLRRLRGRLGGRPASRDQVKNVRDHVTAAATFLDWLEERGLTLAACTQADLDQWLAGTSAVLARSANFVRWAVSRRHANRLTAPATRWTGPSGPLDQDRRWADARRLLHDNAYPAADRVAGLLILLYAQKLNVITAPTAQHVLHEDGRTLLRLGSRPIVLPTPLDDLVTRLAAGRETRGRSLLTIPSPWLFPRAPARKRAHRGRTRAAAPRHRHQPATGPQHRPAHPGRRGPRRHPGQDTRHPRPGRGPVAEDLRRGLDRLRRRRQPPPGAHLRPHRSGLIEFLAPQQRVKSDPVTRQGAGAPFLPVDDAQRMADLGPQLT